MAALPALCRRRLCRRRASPPPDQRLERARNCVAAFLQARGRYSTSTSTTTCSCRSRAGSGSASTTRSRRGAPARTPEYGQTDLTSPTSGTFSSHIGTYRPPADRSGPASLVLAVLSTYPNPNPRCLYPFPIHHPLDTRAQVPPPLRRPTDRRSLGAQSRLISGLLGCRRSTSRLPIWPPSRASPRRSAARQPAPSKPAPSKPAPL